jgi:hypothetical protein
MVELAAFLVVLYVAWKVIKFIGKKVYAKAIDLPSSDVINEFRAGLIVNPDIKRELMQELESQGLDSKHVFTLVMTDDEFAKGFLWGAREGIRKKGYK